MSSPGGQSSPADRVHQYSIRLANCTVFDGTVPYFDPCTVCTIQPLQDTKCTVFLANQVPDFFFQNVGLKSKKSHKIEQKSFKIV